MRRGGDVERAVEPHRPFGEHHVRREDRGLVELAVAVGVFEPDDAVRLLLDLLGDLLVGAGRVGDVEPALLVEGGDDGPVDERRPGGQLDGEADRQREGVAVEFDLVEARRHGDWRGGSARDRSVR